MYAFHNMLRTVCERFKKLPQKKVLNSYLGEVRVGFYIMGTLLAPLRLISASAVCTSHHPCFWGKNAP